MMDSEANVPSPEHKALLRAQGIKVLEPASEATRRQKRKTKVSE